MRLTIILFICLTLYPFTQQILFIEITILLSMIGLKLHDRKNITVSKRRHNFCPQGVYDLVKKADRTAVVTGVML